MDKGIHRRAVLAGLGTLLLAGCATRTVPNTTPSSLPPIPTQTPTPVVETPTAVPGVSTQGIIDKYRGVMPQQWGTAVSGVTQRLIQSYNEFGAPRVALTFDACGGPRGSKYDVELVNFLIANNLKATFFLNKRWIEANETLAWQLFETPLFEIANHGTTHKPLSVSGGSAYGIPGTASAEEVVHEVWTNHQYIETRWGRTPYWFRSGTAHYDDVSVKIVEELGERVAGFEVNADAGATLNVRQVSHMLCTVQPGSVVIMHANQPQGGTAEGLLQSLAWFRERSYEFVHLDRFT